ncbi:hypothetical protein DSO57_1023318 [Entomophthora muscae]|uniref:Uncharacterized protein n=1 Tax=Entomophthora muscae TaxID=34485 RepID=A0ACC2SRV5_9FUNG|nr:hypothetical protein DSO57_1023318 [Entomophthora muscae]
MRNKEALSYFILDEPFYTCTRKAKVTVLIDTGVSGNFMNHSLARSMDLLCLSLKVLLGATMDILLFHVILGVGWRRQHWVHINGAANEQHFFSDGTSGFLSLLKPGEEPPKSCLSLKASLEVPPPVLISGILTPYQDAFDMSLATGLPQHTHHDLDFCTKVDLVKIDTYMYPLNEHNDKALGVWTNNMLVKGWIVKKPSSVSSLVVFAEKSGRTICLMWIKLF